MDISRRHFTALALASGVVPGTLAAQDTTLQEALDAQVFGTTSEYKAGLKLIAERGNPDMAAGLIRALRFTDGRRKAIGNVLEEITGERHGTSWFDWMLWQEKNPQIIPHPSHIRFTRRLLLQVDPNFADFLRPEYLARDRMRIRLEEIAWGGVQKDGIPSLDRPDLIAAQEATYLRGSDLVFGVAINGDVRAYPLRIMGWHEMFNEVIGGVPVALAYCTLCGSGILFETRLAGRSKPLVFGSSGFLYRSNKLMFDRESHSLWNQFTGKPVVGPLAASGIELRQRPVVITTWDNWTTSHPTSKVLSLNTGHRRNYGSGVVYANYFASPDLMFPAQVDQSEHRQKDYVFTIRQFGAARAWPLAAFKKKPVIHDAIGSTNLLLLGSEETRSVRAYERGEMSFVLSDGALKATDGSTWIITEDAVIGPDGSRLPRVAGHIAYWFAWDNYLGGVATVYKG
ncbi:DUF3179 domain-containing protein [Roseobacter sp. YSTF-M11]|uniref:DUF3179 domain-containing protein n=1 Tax=Roseobacter insulae TaxID=2859783 RepID=A0A9X1FX19_9RHOB|nr:DUF3179 domain-containing protein [Roseobacter insulae]MBW4709136.1 DUF3179 domain-containing protein [Roseobacter insulae]